MNHATRKAGYLPGGSPRHQTKFVLGCSLLIGLAAQLSATAAQAHGMVAKPIARQYQCYKDGGFWAAADGSRIPNPGCRAAYLAGAQSGGQTAGVYPFQQHNEVAANPQNYEDLAAVQRAVPNGLLCAGGDPRKRGLDVPQSRGWAKTVVTPVNGAIDLTWDATAPHNPSFVRVFVTKPGWSPDRELHWEDLDLLYQGEAPQPDRSVYPAVYRYRVPFPANRSGDAMIYSIWQRRDAGNEGFFNCSDITIQQHDAPPPPFPWVEEKPFIDQAVKPVPGEQVRFRVMGGGASGGEVVDVKLPITAQNRKVTQWAAQLGQQINRSYFGQVQVGERKGDAIQFNAAHIYANKVWLKNNGSSSALSVIPADPGPGPDPVPDPNHQTWPDGIGKYKAGDVVVGLDGGLWKCKPFPYTGWCNIVPNRDPFTWPYAPGGKGVPSDESQRAWVRAD